MPHADYIVILRYCNIPLPVKPNGQPNKKLIKILAENILANDLCPCVN